MQKLALIFLTFLFISCNNKTSEETKVESKEVNVYTHRHYDIDKEIFTDFENKTGIKVNILKANANELITRINSEGENSKADVLIAVDAGNLFKAKQAGITQSINSKILESNIPAHLRDPESHWFGLTKRARIIVANKAIDESEYPKNYEDLISDVYKGKILVRSSSNIYNQSLLASIVSNSGEEEASNWAKGVVANFAREPKGNDRDQVKAIVAGEGDYAIVNTYYMGKLLKSDNPEEVKAGESVNIIFPNQKNRGTHINISGGMIIKTAPNKDNAIKLLEYLSDTEAQSKYAQANFEYPVNSNVKPSDLLQSWGSFKEDQLSLENLGVNNTKAVMIFDQNGWK